jgi:hypothetical protein
LGNNNKPQLVEGYPRSISSDFTGPLPTTVDAAYTWSDNGRVFIVKGTVCQLSSALWQMYMFPNWTFMFDIHKQGTIT